jgi:hypothetical protein
MGLVEIEDSDKTGSFLLGREDRCGDLPEKDEFQIPEYIDAAARCAREKTGRSDTNFRMRDCGYEYRGNALKLEHGKLLAYARAADSSAGRRIQSAGAGGAQAAAVVGFVACDLLAGGN